MAQPETKKVTEVDAEQFAADIDEMVHERGDGAGPAQYVHEVDNPEPFTPVVTIVPTEDPNITPEVHVQVDKVVPLVTQDDPAGYGTLSVPIHAFVGAKTVEEVFAEEAGELKQVSDEERASAAAEGRTARAEAVDKS